MAPSLANNRASDASDDDDDDAAPESVTLNQSKADVKRLDEAKQTAEAHAKRKKREKNKLIDENLKKRALETRGTSKKDGVTKEKKAKSGRKGKESEKRNADEEGRDVEGRMERAMVEAQEEEGKEEAIWTGFSDDSGSEDDSVLERRRHSVSSSDQEEVISLQSIEEGDDDSSMDDVEDASSDDSPDTEPVEKPTLDYLPEHLFSEVLSKAQAPSKREAASTKTSLKMKPEQRRKPVRRQKAKDIVLGSKTLRMVAPNTTHNSTAAARTVPPGKIRRFYEDHLSLKSKSSKTRNSWDRRPANIGIMRNSALPAANFVRNS